jgi:3-oxoacyl-[acyl-carrier-protein] synthase II
MLNNMRRRVVVTGLGVVAANGTGKEAFWDATSKGNSGIQPISRFSTENLPIQVAGEVKHLVVEQYIKRKLAHHTDRMTHFALVAIEEALQDAKLSLDQENLQRVGAVIANSLGGVEFVIEQIAALYLRGPRAMSPYTAIAWLHVSNVGQASVRYGIQGYCKTPVNDTVGGLDAIGMAYNAIQRGAADVIIAGGCEAPVYSYLLLILGQSDYCITGSDPHAYRPFDRRANGLLLGEGAGICILEEYEHARQRGAPIYGEITGYGQTTDAHGPRGVPADGKQYARAMRLAMQEANILPEHIAYFSLDGRALPPFDASEFDALSRTFGAGLERLPVSVPRTMLGHSYAAAGALDTITTLLALKHNLVPPTINCEELDPRYELNLVRHEARPLEYNGATQSALIGGRGTGGTNVVLAIKKL